MNKGYRIIGGRPHHIDVWYDSGPRIWWAQVYNRENQSLDIEYSRGRTRSTYVMDAGTKQLAIKYAKELQKRHKIPINVYQGGKIVRRI